MAIHRLRRKTNPPRKCIFCDGGNLSKEHLWSDWMAELLPAFPANQHEEHLATFTQKTRLVGPPQFTKRNGQLWTKKIRVVCADCNSEWMSALDNEAKPLLAKLIGAQPHSFSVSDSQLVAQWTTLKVLVAEHNRPLDAVASADDRKQFKATRQIPTGVQIWLGRCGIDPWRVRFERHSATVGRSPIVMPHHRFKNIQSIALGLGDLMLFVIHTSVAGVDLKLMPPPSVKMLYPNSEPFDWPLSALSMIEATGLATSLQRYLDSPQVRWTPGFPG